jgi:hypothetical protein
MLQQSLFDEFQIEDIRKLVMTEITRIPGEDIDEYLEVVRYEVDCRIKELHKDNPKPNYSLHNNKNLLR